MRLIPSRLTAVVCGVGVALYACALAGTFSSAGLARQTRTPADGVYSAAQATRGQQVYETQCVACHGKALEGGVGPLLVGDGFLGAWGGKPLADLVDKIEKTMPLQAPGTLSHQQSIDVSAFILQFNKFKPGGELTGGNLAQVSMPAARTAPAGATASGVALTPTANLAQLMRAVTFPNANIIFNVQVKEPVTSRPAQPVPFDYVLWGNAQYYGWQAIDQAALALIESTPLFLLPGRRCENGQPVPINNADWKPFAQALVDAGQAAFKASQSRNVDAMIAISERLNLTCENCHKRYRDGTAEGTSRGAQRCT